MKSLFLSLILLMNVSMVFSAPEKTIEEKETSNNSVQDEMGTYRAIAEKKVTSYQDLADILAMQTGEFEKKSASQRFELLKKYNLCDLDEKQAEAIPVNRGALAKTILLHFEFEKGLLFAITKWERYAISDVRFLSIMHPKFSQNQHLNGVQLIGALDQALKYSQEIRSEKSEEIEKNVNQ